MRLIFASLLASFAGASTASAAAPLVDVWVGVRGTAERDVPQAALLLGDDGLWRTGELLQPRAQLDFFSAFVGGSLDWQLTSRWSALAVVDSGDVRGGGTLDPPLDARLTSEGRRLREALTSGAMLRELALLYSGAGLEVAAGRRRHRVAQGLVYDDFGTGVIGSLRSGGKDPQLRVEAAALAVGRTFEELERPSPLVTLKLEMLPSLFESFGVFGAFFADRAGTLGEVFSSVGAERAISARFSTEPSPLQLRPVCLENALPADECRRQVLLSGLFLSERASRGWTGYGGYELSLVPADGVSVRSAGVISWGDVDVDFEVLPRALHLDLLGWAAHARVSYSLGDHLGVGALAFGLSGDAPFNFLDREDDRYHAFLGVAPYWTWTALFFSGGVAQSFYAGRASSAGVNGHGVAGGGLWCELATDEVVAELRAVYLGAIEPAPAAPVGGGGRSYGIETDLRIDAYLGEWLSVSGEIDVLWPGGFFAVRDPALRMVVQVVAHHD